MSCPAWEDCNKKVCIEQSVCMGDYWVEFWKRKASEAKEAYKVKKKINRRKFHYAERKLCTKGESTCDKARSCEILGQCIFTIPRFADKPELLSALRGRRTPEQVIKILREHDPEPMRSYYFCQKKKL